MPTRLSSWGNNNVDGISNWGLLVFKGWDIMVRVILTPAVSRLLCGTGGSDGERHHAAVACVIPLLW